jgi:hypothetical protein
MKGMEEYLHAFSTSALDEDSSQLHPTGKSPQYPLDRSLMAITLLLFTINEIKLNTFGVCYKVCIVVVVLVV